MDTQIIPAAPRRPMLQLDLIADLVCPWSFLGKRSLERALENLYGTDVLPLRWHGFPALEPGKPQALDWSGYLAGRLPKRSSLAKAHRNLLSSGRELGITFDLDRIGVVPDTRDAHRLVAIATREGRQNEVVDALFSAFFEKGRDIGDRAVLEDVARECALAVDALSAFDDPEEGREDVAAEEKRLRSLGIVNTPNLLINGRVLVPGPADVPTYLVALDQALFPELPAPGDKSRLH